MIDIPCKYCSTVICVNGISYCCPKCDTIHIVGGSEFDLVACYVLFNWHQEAIYAYIDFRSNDIRVDTPNINKRLKCRNAKELSLEDIQRKIATHLIFS